MLKGGEIDMKQSGNKLNKLWYVVCGVIVVACVVINILIYR